MTFELSLFHGEKYDYRKVFFQQVVLLEKNIVHLK